MISIIIRCGEEEEEEEEEAESFVRSSPYLPHSFPQLPLPSPPPPKVTELPLRRVTGNPIWLFGWWLVLVARSDATTSDARSSRQ